MRVSSQSHKVYGNKFHTRTKLTNGKDSFLLPSIDGRSVAARRVRDLYGSLIVDLGGEDAPLSFED